MLLLSRWFARPLHAAPNAALVGKRVIVVGKGVGRVLRVRGRLAQPTKHVVQWDNDDAAERSGIGGTTETLRLQKRAGGKGHKFYVVDDGQVAVE